MLFVLRKEQKFDVNLLLFCLYRFVGNCRNNGTSLNKVLFNTMMYNNKQLRKCKVTFTLVIHLYSFAAKATELFLCDYMVSSSLHGKSSQCSWEASILPKILQLDGPDW